MSELLVFSGGMGAAVQSGPCNNVICNSVNYRQHFARTATLALLIAALAGCATPPQIPDPASQLPKLEKRIAELVSQERQKAEPKARMLAVDPELAAIAKKRSEAMAKTNSFAAGDDPHASATMLMNENATFQGLVGENVAAQRYIAKDGIDVETFAKRFVESWRSSKPHLENLSFPDYDRTGVGASLNADTVYVAQIFTTDLGYDEKSGKAEFGIKTVPSAKDGKDSKDAGTKDAPPLRGAIGTPVFVPQSDAKPADGKAGDAKPPASP